MTCRGWVVSVQRMVCREAGLASVGASTAISSSLLQTSRGGARMCGSHDAAVCRGRGFPRQCFVCWRGGCGSRDLQ